MSSVERLLGRVKWFNNKAGYGFITVTDGSRSGTDVFVHHSAINVENDQYKYLVQGEYVEFEYVKTNSDKHEWQASNVVGVKDGKLMCETRHETRVARSEYKTTKTSEEPRMHTEKKSVRQRGQGQTGDSRQNDVARQRGEGPRWTMVGDKSKTRQVRSNKGSTIITIQSK